VRRGGGTVGPRCGYSDGCEDGDDHDHLAPAHAAGGSVPPQIACEVSVSEQGERRLGATPLLRCLHERSEWGLEAAKPLRWERLRFTASVCRSAAVLVPDCLA
jgi:hypothetical protein